MNYLHYFVAVYVRLLAERPKLNRFIMNNKVYARHDIQFSITIKKKLVEDADETVVKFTFNGTENIEEITTKINSEIKKAIDNPDDAKIMNIVTKINKMPAFLKKFTANMLLRLDDHGMLPKSVIDASPFHTSVYLTYLKSIKQNYIYHHLYNVGNAGVFIAVGKVNEMPIALNGQLMVKKCVEIGYTVDERICDGLYLGNSFRRARKIIENPEILEQKLDKRVLDEE